MLLRIRFAALLWSCALVLSTAAPIPSADCNANGVPDEEDLAGRFILGLGPGLPIDELSPAVCAIVDIDRDGRLDVAAVSSAGASNLVIFRATGSRSFAAPVPHQAGSRPIALAAGDVSGDGAPDLVTADGQGKLLVFENEGSTKLGSPVPIETGGEPVDLSSVDIDQDGDLDLVVAFAGPAGFDSARVLGNDGSGRFELPGRAHRIAGTPTAVLTSDLDRDGAVDLAMSGEGTVSILFNKGDGDLGAPLSLPGGFGSVAVEADDLDEDGSPDLAVLYGGKSGGDSGVTVLRQAARRAFDAGPLIPLPRDLTGLALDDFDGDRHVDLAVSVASDGTVVILWSDGSAGFQVRQTFTAGIAPSFLAARDLDGDGRIDLAAPDGQGGRVQLLYNAGSRSFLAPRDYAALGVARSIAHGDLDRDGDRDIAFLNGVGNLSIYVNDGKGILAESTRVAFGSDPYFVDVADLDGDGHLDLFATDPFTDGVYIIRGAESGPATPLKLDMETAPIIAIAADLDGDADLDLAVTLGDAASVALLRNDGTGSFRAGDTLATGGNPHGIASADLDADGDLDLAAGDNVSVSLWRNDGTGLFGSQTELDRGHGHELVFLIDVDLDGDADLLAEISSGIHLLTQNDGGTFSQARRIGPVIDLGAGIVADDLDGDGDMDLAAPERNGFEILILLNTRGGTFETLLVKGISAADRIAAADLDGDGDDDLVLGNHSHGKLTVLDNASEPPASLDEDGNGIPDECESRFERCNVNGDARKDIGDGIWILNRLFRGGPEIACAKAADCNDDGSVSASDAVFIFQYQLKGGTRPADPFDTCGLDPTSDTLDCLDFASPGCISP